MSGAEQGPPADASGRNRMHRNVVSSCLARCSASRQRVLRHRTMCPLRYGGSSRGRRAKTCHRRRCFDAHADEQNHGSLARTAKHSAPETGALRERRQRRSGVHAQFWSVAFVRDSPLQVKLKCGVDVTPPAESDLLCNGNFKLTRNGRREKSTGSLAPQSAATSVTKMPTEVVASRSLPAGTSTSESAPISMR
jgi:hypothetical protein